MLKKGILSLTLTLTLTLLISAMQLLAQKISTVKDLDLNMERKSIKGALSPDWFTFYGNYIIGKDSSIKHNGNYSLAIKSPEGKLDKQGITAITFSADFSGKTIELQGYLKLDRVIGGYAGLFLRADGENGVLFYDFMRTQNLTGTKEWARYSVKLPLTENVKTLWVGVGLYGGTGQVWADDLKVLIDGKDISLAKAKIKMPAELDTTFLKGSKVAITNLEPQQIKNIALLGQIWGFLKYHHPVAYSGTYNWDFELFRILPNVLKAGSVEDRNKVFLTWMNSLGAFKVKKAQLPNAGKVKIVPDAKWINTETLGPELYELLLRINDAERKPNYYVSVLNEVPVPQFKHESSYATIKNPDVGFRLLSLFRYWNIIHYYFPYKYLIAEDWNTVLEEYIPKYIKASSEIANKRTVKSLIARIHDSHAYMTEDNSALSRTVGLRFPAIEVKFIEDKPVVTGYLDEKLGRSSGLKRGDILLSVNKTPVEQLVKDHLPFISASNYPTKLRNLSSELLKTNDSLLNISYSRNNSIIDTQIPTYTRQVLNLYKNSTYQDTCLKILNKDVAYFNPGSVKKKYLADVLKAVSKTKHLIIDLRSYPREPIVKEMGEYLLEKPTPFVKFTKVADQPGLFLFDEPLEIGKKNPDFYKGKVIMLVNEVTQSNAEFTAMGFSTAKNAIIIGSQTAGADGNVTPLFNLPGGISTLFTGLGVYYPDGKETQRIGIIPDIIVEPTIKGILEGKDEILDKAMKIIAADQ
ncbi:S41 family peptidase [Pedobacter immunditicola]|uniref:S41 family peptidase n=1 Tax=Pedobacter immunditicola TaxID=3133440 RepID=UPI0030956D70